MESITITEWYEGVDKIDTSSAEIFVHEFIFNHQNLIKKLYAFKIEINK